jgi:hypothetical protein
MSLQPTFRPLLEPLESRELLTGIQAYVTSGNLYVLGTGANDYINITQTGSQISLTGAPIAVKGVNANSIDSASINNVLVYGNGGSDFINLSTVKNNASIYGGRGDDIIRCGTGKDIVYNGGGYDSIFHPFDPTKPNISGEAVADVRQGQAPYCQTLAALTEAVQQGHDFSTNITSLGKNLYSVKLATSTQTVYFDGWTNSNDPVTSGGEYWMVLMQRARLQSLGMDPTRDYTTAEWDSWNVKTGGRLYSIADAMYSFTGSYPSFIGTAAANAQTLQTSLAHGDSVVAQSRSAGGTSADGVVGNHAYAVLAVYNDAGTWKVRLYNPWGMDRDNGTTMDAIDKSRAAANDGFITLTWAQFTNSNNFKGYYVGVKK